MNDTPTAPLFPEEREKEARMSNRQTCRAPGHQGEERGAEAGVGKWKRRKKAKPKGVGVGGDVTSDSLGDETPSDE